MRNHNVNSDQLRKGWCEIPNVLQRLGYSELRKGQKSVICNVLADVDTICVLPTSGGKTATFVIPTLALNWKTVVFSPLVALIRDQVQSLNKKRIPAMAMTSMQSTSENKYAVEQWAAGNLSFLYVAPERIHNEAFNQAMKHRSPDMIVVDEAHCISQWSDNFRSSYCEVGPFIGAHNPHVVLACTATCPEEVEGDIRRVLGLENAKKLVYFPRRTNLILGSRRYVDDRNIAEALSKEIDGPAIVYCATVAKTEEMASTLNRYLREDVIHFHGQLNDSDKKNNMDAFMSNRIRVICATNAFGMGVDKPDIRGVIHRDIPGSIEALAQEVGRAGRDGKESQCLTYLAQDSVNTQKFFIETSHPSTRDVQRVFEALRRSADMSGMVELTVKELGRSTGISQWTLSSIMEILKAHGVIERIKDKNKTCKIRPVYPLPKDDRIVAWLSLVENLGIKDDAGYYSVDLTSLVESIGMTNITVTNWLRKWQDAGHIKYIPPFSGTPTKISGSLANIDFGRLQQKADEASSKLNKVLEYCRIPDEAKHQFLEDYFQL